MTEESRNEPLTGQLADAYWQQIQEGLDAASKDFDRAVFTLSSGALVLSITFLRDIAPQPVCLGLVIASWIFMVISVAAVLGSFYASERAHLHSAQRFVDGEIDSGRGGAWGKATDVLNRAAGLTFLVGAILLVWFAIANLPKGG